MVEADLPHRGEVLAAGRGGESAHGEQPVLRLLLPGVSVPALGLHLAALPLRGRPDAWVAGRGVAGAAGGVVVAFVGVGSFVVVGIVVVGGSVVDFVGGGGSVVDFVGSVGNFVIICGYCWYCCGCCCWR